MTYTRTLDDIKRIDVIVNKEAVVVNLDYWDDRSACFTMDKILWSLPYLIKNIQWQLDSMQSYNAPIKEKQNGKAHS